MYCVMYNNNEVIWVFEKEISYHEEQGFKVYKMASSEKEAEKYCEEACYIK